MAEEKWEVAGYIFTSKQDYEKAKKEADSIAYIKERTNWKDKQQLLKLYNKAVDCKMFQTVLGYEFMHQLQSMVAKSGIIEEEYMKPIPICKQNSGAELPEDAQEAVKLANQYHSLYEVTKEEKKRLKIVIGFLVLTVGLMMVLAYTNYKTYDESAVIDKYSSWENELEQREAAVMEKERELGIDTSNTK
ncbi:MAG: hypothetical protein HFJ09_00940 [Lachnospiraceae bacterium]|nr:hypothetical protein [Lachnospiraceae bacterium]